MQQNMPVTFGFVNRKIQEMWQQDAIKQQQQAEQAAAEAAEAPKETQAPNQQAPGTRKKDQVEITGDKQKGPTKGNV
jgi:hypothetical protein